MYRVLSCSVFAMSLLVACASEPVKPAVSDIPTAESVNADYRILSMVTSGKENLHLKPGSKFYWLEEVKLIGVEDQGRAQLFKNLIEQDLQNKGFQFVNTIEESEVQITTEVVIGALPEGDARLLNPGLHASDKDKGSLIIFIHQPPTRIVWRGAAQVYTGETLTEAFRVERSRKAIHGLLRDVDYPRFR